MKLNPYLHLLINRYPCPQSEKRPVPLLAPLGRPPRKANDRRAVRCQEISRQALAYAEKILAIPLWLNLFEEQPPLYLKRFEPKKRPLSPPREGLASLFVSRLCAPHLTGKSGKRLR